MHDSIITIYSSVVLSNSSMRANLLVVRVHMIEQAGDIKFDKYLGGSVIFLAIRPIIIKIMVRNIYNEIIKIIPSSYWAGIWGDRR